MNKDKNKSISISWEELQSMGNPEKAAINSNEEELEIFINYASVVRIYLDRKGRRGKAVSLIKGIEADEEFLIGLAKELKKKCGVGGSCKNDEILIQGNFRDKIKDELKAKGFTDVKMSGG